MKILRESATRRLCISSQLLTTLAVAVIATSMIAPATSAGDIQWRSPQTDLVARSAVPIGQSLADQLTSLAPSGQRHVVVQLNRPVDDDLRAELQEYGATLLDYLGDNAFFATLDAELLDASAIESTSVLASAGAIEPIVKLHPILATGEFPDWAVVNADTQERPVIGAYIMFHRDVDLATEAAPLMELYGAAVRDALETVNALVVEVELDAIDALAQEDSIQWIEQALPLMSHTNDSNRSITQVNTVQTSPYNLDGSGVTVLVYDGGTARASHNDFGGRCTVYDSSGMHYHPTHVAGTIGGDGSSSGGTYRGMAPATILLSYGFEYDGSGTFLYTNPGDIESDYLAAMGQGADVANNSIGTNVETNGFPCSYQGDYGLTSSVIDKIVRGDGSDPDFDTPFRIVWANGNERQGSTCDVEGYGDYYSTAPPAGAKNHLAIGALNSNNDSMTSFSSWGPVDDGRIKPDFSTTGCQSNGDGGVTSTGDGSDTQYITICGTSMAAPTMTGMAALFLEDYRAQYPASADPRNSTLKSIVAQTAVDLGNTGPDYQYGYGSVRIKDAIDLMRAGDFDENSLTQGGIVEYQIQVNPGDPFKVTLAWDDYPGTPNVNPALVNDLDLRVYDPSATRRYPWTLNPSSPSSSAVRTSEDHINNIEQVVVDSPASGVWTVQVFGNSVPQGPQPFSICASSAMSQGGVTISFPSGLPTQMAPSVATNFDVEIVANGESIVGGSPTLHYRYDGGTWLTSSLAALGGNLYQATLPAAACDDTPEFYVSAQGTVSGLVTNPANAPTGFYSAIVGELTTIIDDDFETNQGWTATNLGASSGDWQRGVPVNDSGWDYDPASDSDGSGQCYLTQNQTGNTDVDGGSVRLTSPTMDMSGGGVTISYDYYLYLTNEDGTDRLLVEIDSNGGSGPWTEIARHDTDGGLSWRSHTIDQTDLDSAGVSMTANMVMRFTANDGDSQSIVEAGLDAFLVTGFSCDSGVTYTLTVNTTGQGSVSLNPPGGTYSDGEIVTLTANADPGWTFSHWTGALTGSTNPDTVTMDSNKTVTAVFTQDQYTLTINTTGSGSVGAVPSQATYVYGDVVTLTANADPGWTFSNWSGDLTGSTNPDTITMDGNKTVTAIFTQDQYTLTVNTSGSGSVGVVPSQATYVYGDVVTLTANANPGWTFSNWTGDLTGSTNPDTITMDGNKTVTAVFTQNQYTLTINVTGSGSVGAVPDQATYVYGDVVTLTANADPGWTFSNWTGDLTGSTNPDTITIDGNKTVTAVFTQDQYTLTVNVSGSGSVGVVPDQATYVYGDVVTLTANADPGWTFANWTGDLTGSTNPDTITMDGNKSVTAVFTQNQYTLTINVTGNGSVDAVPDQATYNFGDVVTLTANADPGWTFSNWTGDLTGSTNPDTITMDGNKTVTAVFTQNQYTLTINVTGSGSVDAVPDQATYVYGDVVTLTANADPGWTFANWTGDLTGSTNPDTITIDGDKTVTAVFTQDQYTLTINITGSGSVDAVPDQATYTYGDVVTLTANADPGWNFSNWSGDLTGSTNPDTITMDGDKTVTAIFTEDAYTLTVNVSGSGSVGVVPDQATYNFGDIVTLTANADPGWTFSNWTGDLTGSTNPDTITMDGNKTVTAVFTQDEYTLTVNVTGSGSVGIVPDQATYSFGDVVTLTANADPGWTFSNWSGDLTGSTNPDTITMDGSKTVTAVFTQDAYTLTVNVTGSGSVGVVPDQATYDFGDVVTLTANADPGWTFDHWEGDLTGSTNPDTVTMDGSKTVTAVFTQNAYTLTVNVTGNGTVDIVPDQPSYNFGDMVDLTANADPGWSFDHWEGDLTGNFNPDTITIDGDKTVTAVFTQDCLGDLDHDGDVDLSDLAQMLSNYGVASGATYEDGDLDGDGDVDLSDLALLLSVYGAPC